MTLSQSRRFRTGFLWLVVLGLLAWALGVVSAQTMPIFRIGVLDNNDGALLRGAQLAVEEINASGGVQGADGTMFRLEIVAQPVDNLQIGTSIANIGQASVIAVIGPEKSADALNNLPALQALRVPILTTATDDTLIAIDTTDQVIRIRAQEALQGRALANYLTGDLGASSIVTVQLDLESTASVVGFSTALSALGTPVQQSFLFDANNPIPRIAQTIVQNDYQIVATYGTPKLASELYIQLRDAEWGGIFAYNQTNAPDFRSAVPTAQLSGILSTTTWSYANNDPISQAFVNFYIRAFGEVPNEIAAASYDGIYLLADAIGKPGDLLTNIYATVNFQGVQGFLNPATLTRGETSNNVSVTELGIFGAPFPVVRFAGNQRVIDSGSTIVQATATPAATNTPEGVFVLITRNAQNVRTGPGTNYEVIGQLKQNETAQVIGATADYSWVVISFRGQNGWLSTDILELNGDRRTIPVVQAPPTPTPPPATATPTAQPFPDIVVLSAVPNRLTINAPFSISITIANQGAVNATPFAIATSLTPGNIFSAINLPGLAAGQQTIVTLTGTLAAGSTGPQSVQIIADLNNELNEGTSGEANNNTYTYAYVADAPLLVGTATGTVTIGDLATFSLDGGSADIQWGGGGIVPLGGAQIGLMNGYPSIESTHYDVIFATPLSSNVITPAAVGQIIAIRTDGGNKLGVFVINSISGGTLTFTFRMYNL
jgi:branched-chain amino acid transport system substrate-binding protein